MQDQEEGRGLDLNRLNSLRKMSLKSSAMMHEAAQGTTQLFFKQLPLTHTLEPLGQGCTLQSEIDFQDCVSSSICCMISFISKKQILYIHCVKSFIFNESNVVEHSRSEL